MPFETADAGFARIAGDDLADRVIGDTHLRALYAVLFQLLRQQMPLGDLQFFLVRVRPQFNDLHPVEQGAGDGVGRVGGGDEHAVGQIERHLNIMVAEAGILCRVQNLQQCRRRIALIIAAEFVNFVEQQQRVFALGLNESRHNAARHSADICLAVAANLGLVPDATQRNARKFAAQRPGNRNGHRGLADTGRADQADDLAVFVFGQLLNGKLLDDALLDLVKAVVVLVQPGAYAPQIQTVVRFLVPRQVQTGVKVVAYDCRLRGRGRHVGEPGNLLEQRLGNLLVQVQRLDLLAVFHGLAEDVLPFSQLILNGLELLAQVVFAMVLIHLLLDLRTDLLLHMQDVDFPAQQRDELLQTLHRGKTAQNGLLAVVLEVEVGGHIVGQGAWLLDGEHRQHHLGRELGQIHGIFLENGLQLAHSPQSRRFVLNGRLRDGLHCDKVELLARDQLQNAAAGHAFDQHAVVVVGDAKHLLDDGNGADVVELPEPRIVVAHVPLRDQKDGAALFQGKVQCSSAALAPHVKMNGGIGKDHQAAQGDHGDFQSFLRLIVHCFSPMGLDARFQEALLRLDSISMAAALRRERCR